VQMVEAFDVGGESAAVFGVYLDLGWPETGFGGFREGDGNASIVYSQRVPGCVNFRAGGFSEYVFIQERAVVFDDVV
jgi:hypothetical protein